MNWPILVVSSVAFYGIVSLCLYQNLRLGDGNADWRGRLLFSQVVLWLLVLIGVILDELGAF